MCRNPMAKPRSILHHSFTESAYDWEMPYAGQNERGVSIYDYACAHVREGLPCNWPSMPPRASRMPEDSCSAPDVASASLCMSTSVRFPKLSCMWYMQMLQIQ